MLRLYNSASEYVYSARWMKREGEKKDERMADEKRKRYSPNDSVKCHIGAQRRERGAGCAI